MSHFNILRLLPLYFAVFCGHVGISLLFPVMPLYAQDLGASVATVGLVVGMTSYASALTMIPFGLLCDRIGRRGLLVGGLLASSLVPLLYITAGSPLQLIAVRVVHGLAIASFIPAANVLVVDMAEPARRGEALGWFMAAIMMGAVIGPVSGGYLLSYYGYSIVFYGCSLCSLLALMCVLPWLRGMAGRPAGAVSGEGQWRWLRQRSAVAGLLTVMFTVIGSGTILAFSPLYGEEIGIRASQVGLIVTAMYGASALLRGPAGVLADRFGRGVVVLFGFLVCAAAISLFSVFTSFTLLIAVGIVFGLGMGLGVTASFAMVADAASPNARGVAMGAANSVLQAGLAIGATVMGGVATALGFRLMFAVCGAILACGLFTVLLLIWRRRHRSGLR